MKNLKGKTKIQAGTVDGLAEDGASFAESAAPSVGRGRLHFPLPSKTQQQFKASVDPNQIIRNYMVTGVDPYAHRQGRGVYADATAKSYTEAMFLAAEVKSRFAELPARVRSLYSNDPAEWLLAQQSEAIVDSEASQGLSDDSGADPAPEPPTTEAD